MMLLAFSLFDTKAQFFNVPFFVAHRGQAVRAVIDLGSDLNTSVGRFPNDFHLYELGVYDDQTGQYTSQHPQNMGPVASFLPDLRQVRMPLEDAAQ